MAGVQVQILSVPPHLLSPLHQSSDTICCFYPQAHDGTCYADKTGSWGGLTIQNSCSSHRNDFRGVHIWQKWQFIK